MENSTDPSQTCPAARSFVLPPSGLLVFCAQPPCAPNMDSFAFSCAPANCEKREAKKNRNSRVIKMLVVKWPLRTLLFPANKQQSNWAYVTLKRSIRGQSGGLPMQRRGRYPRGSPRWVWILDWGILLGHELISLKEQCAQVLCRFTLHTNNDPRLLDKCHTWYLGKLSEYALDWLIDWLGPLPGWGVWLGTLNLPCFPWVKEGSDSRVFDGALCHRQSLNSDRGYEFHPGPNIWVRSECTLVIEFLSASGFHCQF